MSDDATPRLGLPYVAAGQAQKHVTVNEAFARLDGLVQATVVSRSIAVQPATPDEGALYLLPDAAAGDVWSAEAPGALMRFEAGSWTRLQPGPGHILWVADEGLVLVLDGVWRPLAETLAFDSLVATASPGGARTRFAIREEDVTLAGPETATTLAIPARSIVLAVGTRTLTAVTGATAYDCGVAGETGKFGGSLGAAAGSSNIGVVGPTAFYADTPVLLTALGGDFTGGVVRVAAHLVEFDAPAA